MIECSVRVFNKRQMKRKYALGRIACCVAGHRPSYWFTFDFTTGLSSGETWCDRCNKRLAAPKEDTEGEPTD